MLLVAIWSHCFGIPGDYKESLFSGQVDIRDESTLLKFVADSVQHPESSVQYPDPMILKRAFSYLIDAAEVAERLEERGGDKLLGQYAARLQHWEIPERVDLLFVSKAIWRAIYPGEQRP